MVLYDSEVGPADINAMHARNSVVEIALVRLAFLSARLGHEVCRRACHSMPMWPVHTFSVYKSYVLLASASTANAYSTVKLNSLY